MRFPKRRKHFCGGTMYPLNDEPTLGPRNRLDPTLYWAMRYACESCWLDDEVLIAAESTRDRSEWRQ
jgi:hypothetical protein